MGSTREACCSERMNFKYIQPSPPERNQSVALISTPAMEVNQRLRGTAEEQSHPGKPRTGLSAGIFRPVGLHVCATSLEHSTIPGPRRGCLLRRSRVGAIKIGTGNSEGFDYCARLEPGP